MGEPLCEYDGPCDKKLWEKKNKEFSERYAHIGRRSEPSNNPPTPHCYRCGEIATFPGENGNLCDNKECLKKDEAMSREKLEHARATGQKPPETRYDW